MPTDRLNIPRLPNLHHPLPFPTFIPPPLPISHSVPPIALWLIDTVKHDSFRFERHHRRPQSEVREIRKVKLFSGCKAVHVMYDVRDGFGRGWKGG